MIISTALQGSDEWLQDRAGKITASMFKVCCEKLKNGEYSAVAKKYAFRLAVERISGQFLNDDQFDTWAMRRGRELEPVARYVHEQRIGMTIDQIGFVSSDCGFFGASLDGIIGDDGSSEYKCFVSPASLMPILLDDDISDIRHQAMGGLMVTGRKWVDVCLYCPPLESVDLDFSMFRVERDDDFINKMRDDLLEFNNLVVDYMSKLKSKRSIL